MQVSDSALKYVFVIAIIFIALGGGGYWYYSTSIEPGLPIGPEGTSTPGVSDTKTYHNEEFGFEFEYPSDWEVRIPAFGSAASLFNMDLGGVVTINITAKDWMENALVKMRARGVVVEDTVLSDYPALVIEDKDWIGRPATLTLALVNDEYWIDITGVKGYEEGYNQILESFRFIK